MAKSHKIYNIISMNYGYIRVSTDKQTVENQRYEITEFAQKNDLIICSELSRLGDDIQSKVSAFAFGLSAEIERNLIS